MTGLFEVHSLWFLLGLAFFPRITVWFFSNVIGGLFFWPGFMIFPRAYCAVLGVLYYWSTDPVLAVLGIATAAIGEPLEKYVIYKMITTKSRCCSNHDLCCKP